jgi:hypothetical protein
MRGYPGQERLVDGRFPRLGNVQNLDFASRSSVMMGSLSP